MADDELNLAQPEPGDQPEGQESPGAAEPQDYRARVAELEGLIAEREQALGLAHARIADLEQEVAGLNQRLTAASDSLFQAIAGYKALVIKSNPGVLEEMVTGDTIAEIDASLEKTRAIIARVKQGLEAELALARVPAGAPQRAPLDLSALSSREKIKYAIGGKR
ncbi:MAG: hypothetical protein HY530_00925 [Chloroflexi bacterium]|nr:hypothetical protein [Chloroflexota bacterium]